MLIDDEKKYKIVVPTAESASYLKVYKNKFYNLILKERHKYVM
jgi:hypothetical protein